MSLLCRLEYCGGLLDLGKFCTPDHYHCCFHESQFPCFSVIEVVTVTIFIICRPNSKLLRLVKLILGNYDQFVKHFR